MYNNSPETNGPAPSIHDTPEPVNLEWVAAKIDAIISDSDHIKSALGNLVTITDAHAPTAIAEVVAAREATNQQALKFLEKVYSDLAPASPASQLPQLDFNYLADYLESEDVVDLIKTLYK